MARKAADMPFDQFYWQQLKRVGHKYSHLGDPEIFADIYGTLSRRIAFLRKYFIKGAIKWAAIIDMLLTSCVYFLNRNIWSSKSWTDFYAMFSQRHLSFFLIFSIALSDIK